MWNRSPSQITCPYCQASIARDSRFCPHCGKPLAGGALAQCPACGKPLPPGGRFCPQCGVEISRAMPPQIESRRWHKSAEDFAVRVELEDVPGFLRRELVIEPGVNAVWLIDGVVRGVVGPGRWTLRTLLDTFAWAALLQTAPRATAILTDIGDVELPFEIGDLRTADPLTVTMAGRLVVRLEDPVRFLTNVMKSAERYTLSDLHSLIEPALRQVAQDWVRQHKVAQLASDPQVKALVELALEEGLNRSLEASGLAFRRLCAVAFTCTPMERFWKAREALVVAQYEHDVEVDARVAELSRRQRLFDVFKEEQLQALAEAEAEVAQHERQMALRARLQEAIRSEKMAEVQREHELERFLDTIDRERLLARKEREDLLRIWREEGEDRDRARAHMLARLELEQRYELETIRLLRQTDLDRAQLEARLEQERRRLENELDMRRLQAAVEREERRLDEIAQREKALEDAKLQHQLALQAAQTRVQQARTEVEVAAAQLELTRLKAEGERIEGELGLLLLEKTQALQRKDEHERLLMQLEVEERRHRMELERLEQQHVHERELLEIKARMTAEQLIAVAPEASGRLIQELRQTELMKGMSADEILARVAAHSPEAARALAERAQALAQTDRIRAEELKQLYERLLAQAEHMAQAREESAREAARLAQQLADRALSSQVDAVRAAREGTGTTPLVIVPGATTPSVGGPAGASANEVVICPRCRAKSPVGVPFCANCGYQFYSTGAA